MAFNWIKPQDYSMDTFLLFDRWIIKDIMNEALGKFYVKSDYMTDMGKALSRYPYVVNYCKAKAPECTEFINKISLVNYLELTKEEACCAEAAILDFLDSYVVYVYPEVMNQVNYIRNWKAETLYKLVDLNNKVVLDVGAGTGRLTFAAANKAKRIYASEPCDMLREYLRDKIKKDNITNVKVLDGVVMNLPYEDSTFDVVLSGHVVGDFYEEEIAELTRVTKNGGWIVCCNGDDEFKRLGPDKELIVRGFEYFRHESIEGGIIYNYRKKVDKFVNHAD